MSSKTAHSFTQMVLEFHEAFGQLRQATPHASVPRDVENMRFALLDEEVQELRDAVEALDIVAIGDALADIAYVVFGTAVTYGIDLDALLREVHLSNMSKLSAEGKPLLRADGKVLKSERYFPPRLAPLLETQPPLYLHNAA